MTLKILKNDIIGISFLKLCGSISYVSSTVIIKVDFTKIFDSLPISSSKNLFIL